MFSSLVKTWKPWIFQGHKNKKHYFEGWYFKCVDAARKHVVSIIPGIALNEKTNNSHAFIQLFDGTSNTSQYHIYPVSTFTASKNTLDIRIATNKFTEKRLDLDIDTDEGRALGTIHLSEFKRWPIHFFTPGFMGWYAFVPYMQCYHGVLGFDHEISGSIEINNRIIDFSGGRGYVEKDWGTSFPRAWIWMQSNHFMEDDISFMCSIATIPWIGNYFTGFGAGFWYKGDLFPFTKWNGSHIGNLSIKSDQTSFTIVHPRRKIEVSATGEDAGELRSPVFGEMAGKVLESLKGKITLKFSILETGVWKTVFSGEGTNGGLEIMGDPKEIIRGIT